MDNLSVSEWVELLVDDELEESDRRRVIEMLESEPEGWKECALGFLEDQVLRSSFKSELFFPDSSKNFPVKGSSKFSADSFENPRKPAPYESRSGFDHTGKFPRSSGTFASPWFFAIAGCLLLGFVLGFFVPTGSEFSRIAQVEPPPPGPISPSNPVPGFPPQSPQSLPSPPSEAPVFSSSNPVIQVPNLIVHDSSMEKIYSGYCNRLKKCPFPPGSRFQAVVSSNPSNSSVQSSEDSPTVQTRFVSLKTGENPGEQILVPCFESRFLDPETLYSINQDSALEAAGQFQAEGRNIDVRRQYFILKSSDCELILIPAEDTIVRYDQPGVLNEL